MIRKLKIFPILLASAFLLHSCDSAPEQDAFLKAVHATADSCCATPLEAGSYTDNSIYNLGSSWVDQDGNRLEIGEMRGTIRVVAMIFTHCEYVCPRLVDDIRNIERLLPNDSDIGYVLVTFDTERDTPDVLRSYSNKMGLHTPPWKLLHGDAGNVLELAALLGVKYKQTASGDFSHSNIITVLNKEGEIAHQQIGLNQDPQQTIDALNALMTPGA